MKRSELLTQLSGSILRIKIGHPLRVAVDGVDASGKTFLANELEQILKKSGRQTIRVSLDAFHNPREIRYKKGRNSPEGYYADSFNNKAVIESVLKPLGPKGDFRYQREGFDYKTNREIASPTGKADRGAILLMDGIFLQRPELVDYWDLKIFLDVGFASTVARAVKRDGWYLGSKQEITTIYNKRYVPGQKLYLEEVNPKKAADIVIDNSDFQNPIIKKGLDADFLNTARS